MVELERSIGFDEYAAFALTDPVVHLRLPIEVGQRIEAMFSRWRELELRRIREKNGPPNGLSVIIPARNRADTIHRPILSLRQQLHVDIELIIVDDASTDGTAERAEALSQGLDAQIIRLSERRGQSAARNIGIEAAHHPTVGFLDADDWWDAAFGTIMTTALEEHGAIPVCTQRLLRPAPHRHTFRYGLVARELLANRNSVSVSAFVAPRDLLRRSGGFPEDQRMYEDWVVAARLASAMSFVAIPAALSTYDTTRAGSVSKESDPAIEVAALELARKRAVAALQNGVGVRVSPRHDAAVAPTSPRTARPRRPCTVAIMSFDQPDVLRRCLEALNLHTTAADVDLIVIDNASTDPQTRELLAHVAAAGRVTVISNTTNGGFTSAVNRAHAYTPADHDLVVVNNDFVVTQGWLEPLRESARRPDVGLVVPTQLAPTDYEDTRKHVPSASERFDTDLTFSEHARNVTPADLRADGDVELRFAPLFCAMIPAEARQVGLPLRGGMHYESDRFFCDVIRLWGGYRIAREPRSAVLHLNDRSGRALRETARPAFERLIDGWVLDRPASRFHTLINDRQASA